MGYYEVPEKEGLCLLVFQKNVVKVHLYVKKKFLLSFGHVAPVITLVTLGITLNLPLKLYLNLGVKVLLAHA